MYRDNRYKYTYSPRGLEELYDMENDPYEMQNLARKEVEKAEEYREKLTKWVTDSNDQDALIYLD